MSEKIMIEVDPRDTLVRHIEGLQRTLTKRNARIEELEARLEAGEGSEYVVKARESGVREGWSACAQSMMNAASVAQRELGNVREAGWKAYLEGQRR